MEFCRHFPAVAACFGHFCMPAHSSVRRTCESDRVDEQTPRCWTEVWRLYTQNTDVFRAVFAHLEARGFRVPPDRRADLVHDFLLERAERVLRRFDPNRGMLRPWLAFVFRRFVLEQLRADARRHRLIAERMRPFASNVTDAEGASDSAAVRAALSELTPEEREALQVYLDHDESLRAAASALRVSRYRARKLVTEAMKRLSDRLEPDRDP